MSKLIKQIVTFLISICLVFGVCSCSSESATTDFMNSYNPNGEILSEDILHEDVINEYISKEIYLKELIIAEDKIKELLLEEKSITEVILCKTIYVPQDNISEFSNNSQTEQLFGDGVDLETLAKKIAIGTGIILTLVVLRKFNIPEPIASVIVGAASSSMKFAVTGAAIGSLYGGLTGAADEIDETQRTSAVISVATATIGLILATVSLIVAIPSGGSSSIGVAAGIKIAIAGISVLGASAGTIDAANNAVKTFKSTDSSDIDWTNVNWNKVGVAAAEQAINNSADGYMWGSITGAIIGGAEGYEYYEKYNAPYSKYNVRLANTPVNGNRGHWTGARGESDFILSEPIVLKNGTKITKVTYKNAVPDFSPYQIAKVKISVMTNTRYGTDSNFNQADEVLAKLWTQTNHNGKTWTERDVAKYRESNNLTWHEMNNMDYMQLVPTEVNATFGHLGGVGEYNAMIGQSGGSEFD